MGIGLTDRRVGGLSQINVITLKFKINAAHAYGNGTEPYGLLGKAAKCGGEGRGRE